MTRLNPDASLSRHAYSQPASNLPVAMRAAFAVGNSFFTAPWVTAPSSVEARDGLGPLYNAAACQDCHIRDGRGHPPDEAGAISSLVKLARPGHKGGDKVYGSQIQDRAIQGVQPEAEVVLSWQYHTVQLAGGESIELREPILALENLAYGPLAPNVLSALRVAPAMIGLGLLENIPEEAILTGADPEDRNGDGISGRVNRNTQGELGRFGWKAAQPSVRKQSLLAFSQDMGITSSFLSETSCSERQLACRQAPSGGQPELSPVIADAVIVYAQHLAVPARRWHDTEEVLQGKSLFHQLGCASCHQPRWQTADNPEFPALSAQQIWPYTDLLLHDMGHGLADGISEGRASGSEWRTPPLWGIHLAKAVGGPRVGYLHDGRARSFKEAILWHGGEARAARDRWSALPKGEREKLIWFLKSL